MTQFKVIKDKDSHAIYKCWLWTIQDENGIWMEKLTKMPTIFCI